MDAGRLIALSGRCAGTSAGAEPIVATSAPGILPNKDCYVSKSDNADVWLRIRDNRLETVSSLGLKAALVHKTRSCIKRR